VIDVDAGVLAVALADDGPDGRKVRGRLRGETLTAPDLIDLEVTSVFRERLLGGHLELRRPLSPLRTCARFSSRGCPLIG
jgi:hypothetical protein